MRKPLIFIFCIDLLVELIAIHKGYDQLRIVSKPLLTILLLIGTATARLQPSLLKSLLLAALFFSLLGDLFLLFEKRNELFFVFGLLGFLTAHILYILLFVRSRRLLNPISVVHKWLVVILLAYVLVFFYLLYPHLGNLKVPVIVYALILATMFLASTYAFSFEKKWQRLVISGALLFVVSDSLLAINKFYIEFPLASLLVMTTYGLAQLFIVLGVCNSMSYVE